MAKAMRSVVVGVMAAVFASGAMAEPTPKGGLGPIQFDNDWLIHFLGIDEIIAMYLYLNLSPPDGELGWWGVIKSVLYPNGQPPRPKRGASDGALERLPMPSLTGCSGARAGFFTPGMKFFYVANGEICAYKFDVATATATPLPGMPFKAGTFTRSITRDRSGSALFAVNQDSNSLSVFKIHPATGALIQPAGSPVATGLTPLAAAVEPSGRYVYVANRGSNTVGGSVSAFAFNRTTGALTPVPGSPFAAPEAAWSIAADPRGRYLYVGGGALQAYGIDGATGTLTPLGTPIPTDNNIVRGVAVDPTGRFVYASWGAGDASGLSAFRIGPTGALTPVGSRQPVSSNPTGVTVDPTGMFVYTVTLEGQDVFGFQIDPVTGALTPIAGMPVNVGGSPQSLTAAGVMTGTVEWVAGEYFSAPMGVGGGRLPYAFAVTAGALPPGLALDSVTGMITGTPATPGSFAFTVQTTDAAGATASQAYTVNVAGAAPTGPVTVVEYYNSSLDHYFITWGATEIAKLDAGVEIRGWVRTGRTFLAHASAQAGTSPICRYYIPPAQGDSHFFGRGATECTDTGQKFPTFILEDGAYMHMTLPAAGVCPAQTVPVYRVFSGRADANHRYTTQRSVRDEMVARGWAAEGDGPDLVVMCAPAGVV